MVKQSKPIQSLQSYLEKHTPQYPIEHPPLKSLGCIVVIPAYRELELLFRTLDSLKKCQRPNKPVEIIVVINASEADDIEILHEQQLCHHQIRQYIEQGLPSWLQIHPVLALNLRKKHFGAGLARKIGLDEAVSRFSYLNQPGGVLACLDADSPVASNYFVALEQWAQNENNYGAIVRFEHPLEGTEYTPQVYEAITLYELHLRYYRQSLMMTGFPYAFHTIGSCMVFRALQYVQAGGMPKKQAGEDFYFLQKLIPLSGFGKINTTTVFPSPRPSTRVIFGTGASLKNHIEEKQKQGKTYNPQVFEDLKNFFSAAETLISINPSEFEEWSYQLSGPLRSFLLNHDFIKDLMNIQQNSSNKNTFLKRFYDIFNAFKVVKYINYAHTHFYAQSSLFDAALLMLSKTGADVSDIFEEKELLIKYREMEKERN
jgi:glycosyltransferase involved in cell wall biosynthesis